MNGALTIQKCECLARLRKPLTIPLLVNETSAANKKGALYQSIAGNTLEIAGLEPTRYNDLFPRTDKIIKYIDIFPRTENTQKTAFAIFPCTENHLNTYPTLI
jgi:hypothetical protein